MSFNTSRPTQGKSPVVIHLDTGLVSQIEAVLPSTSFKTVGSAIADLVVDAVAGFYPCWTQAITYHIDGDEAETTVASEITHDSFHITADRAYSAASEILGVAESQDTDTSQAKAALRQKILELGRLLDDMKRYVGLPVTSPDTQPLPVTRADLDKLETCMKDCRLLYSALSAIISVDCTNETKIDEAVITDVAELLRDQTNRIWEAVDELSISIRKKLVDNGQLEGLK